MDESPFSRAEAKDLSDAEFYFAKFAADSCFGALKACPEFGVAGGFFLENFKIGRALPREDVCTGIVFRLRPHWLRRPILRGAGRRLRPRIELRQRPMVPHRR